MFKLEFNIPKSTTKISLSDSVCLIGSCFSDEMESHLQDNKFATLANPFGTIYNPHSIFKLITNQVPTERVVASQGIYYHWDSHGAVSDLNEEGVQNLFNQRQNEFQTFLTHTNWLIITLGTAIIYEHHKAGIVANCHKVPNDQFRKRVLSQTEIVEQFENVNTHLQRVNPHVNILLTVSPVRHVRDGLVENNRSKAILINAVHTLAEQHSNVHYFPSYEILIDELRDYRFYAEDMIHPSKQASAYIWEKFGEAFFDRETIDTIKKWQKIRAALKHKPFQPGSMSHQKFLKNTLASLNEMNGIIDVRDELDSIKRQIK